MEKCEREVFMSVSSVSAAQMLSRQIFATPRSPSSAESSVAASDAYQLDLSEQALAYLDGSRPLSAVGSSPLNGLNDTGETFAEKNERLQKELQRILLSRNINISGKMDFSLDSSDRLTVSGDHPDKEHIEAILNDSSVGHFASEMKGLLNEAADKAQSEVSEKYKIALEDDDDEDDKKKENEYEKQLRLQAGMEQASRQITALSGNFSFENGSFSFPVLDFAAGFSF